MPTWTPFLKHFLSFFLESNCPLCQRSTSQSFCYDCQRRIQACQLPTAEQAWHQPLPIFAWGTYSGALKRTIATLKYENHPDLAQPLGQWLAQAWLATPLSAPALTVVPIPMHPAKQQQRGFNQAELLAQSFCRVAGIPQAQGLVRIRATEAQFNLSAGDREQNLANAFELSQTFRARRPSCPVLLLDDIYTTGATARAAVQALNQQQIQVYGIVTIARTVQRKQ